MFYSHYVLTKKGPLGKVWIAATLGESRIPKSFASNANIHILCDDIENPSSPFALRLSASLMLGVVRVYSRKSNIFLSDVTTIFHMLSKQQHPTTLRRGSVSFSSRKRSRLEYEQQQQQYIGEKNISLDGTRGLADFEAITLAGGQAVTKSKRFQQTIYDFQESNHDLFMSTMQNIFLSSQSQSHHSDSQSLSFSRGNANPFFAREEDITMKPDISSGSNHNDDGYNHDHELELLPFINLSHSQQSEHQSPDSVRKRLLFNDEQEQSPLFLASNLRLPFHPSSSRQRRHQHDSQGTDAVQPDAPHDAAPVNAIDQQQKSDDRAVVFVQERQNQDMHIPDVTADNLEHIFMPVNMQPLQLPTMPSSGLRSVQQQHDGDHALAASVHASAGISVAAANRTGSLSTATQKRSILQRQPTSPQKQQQGYGRSVTTTGKRAGRRSDDDNDDDEEEEEDEADGMSTRKPKRRKHTQMIFDTVTELTNVQLRNQLDDTSEIVYGENEDRMFVRRVKKIGTLQPPRKGKKGQPRLHPVLTGQQTPGFLSSFPQDIQHTWATNFNVRDHDDRYGNEDLEQHRSEEQQQQDSVQPDGAGVQSSGQNVSRDENEQTPEQMRDVMKNDNNNPTSTTGQGDTNRRMMTAEHDMDTLMPPDIAMLPPIEAAVDGATITGADVEAGNIAGDVDVLRGDGIGSVMLDGGVGSGSIGAAGASDMGGNSRSLSGSFLSSDHGGRTTDNPRDRLFDMITPDDRKSFELAREIATRMRETLWASASGTQTDTDGSGRHGRRRHRRMGSTDAAIPLPMSLASGSSHRIGGNTRDDDLESHVHVNTSEFDLLEQTEEDNDGADSSAMGEHEHGRRIDAIGIRAFKMLSLLRGDAGGGDTHTNIMGGTTTIGVNGDGGGGTTFDALMQGCSVGVRAKGFYNLLSLINHQFVHVRQTKAYDTIHITSDVYF